MSSSVSPRPPRVSTTAAARRRGHRSSPDRVARNQDLLRHAHVARVPEVTVVDRAANRHLRHAEPSRAVACPRRSRQSTHSMAGKAACKREARHNGRPWEVHLEYSVDVGGTKIAYALVDAGTILERTRCPRKRAGRKTQFREVGLRLRAFAQQRGAVARMSPAFHCRGPSSASAPTRAQPARGMGRPLNARLRGNARTRRAALRPARRASGRRRRGGARRRRWPAKPSHTSRSGQESAAGSFVDGEPLAGTRRRGRGDRTPHGRAAWARLRMRANGLRRGRSHPERQSAGCTGCHGQTLGGAEIAARARAGEQAARSVYRRAGRALGAACAAWWRRSANPQAVIVGGSLAHAMDLIQPALERELSVRAWSANLPLPVLHRGARRARSARRRGGVRTAASLPLAHDRGEDLPPRG